MPMSMRKPILALMPSGLPESSSAGMAPMMAYGRLKRMMKGVMSEPRASTITM